MRNLDVLAKWKGERKIPLVIAHRGNPAKFPENSLEGFQDAANMGVDVLETDMCLTKDNRIVLAHDEEIDRVTEGSGEIKDYTLEDLLDFNIGYNYSRNAEYPFRIDPKRMITLEEFFERFPGHAFNLDLKPFSRRIVEEFVKIVKQYSVEDRIIVGSFHTANVNYLRQLLPDIVTNASMAEVKRLVFSSKVGLHGLFVRNPTYQCIQIPIERRGITLLTPTILDHMHKKGVGVHIWTVNERTEMERLIEMGVDGIFTDDPKLLLDVLNGF